MSFLTAAIEGQGLYMLEGRTTLKEGFETIERASERLCDSIVEHRRELQELRVELARRR